MIIPAYSLEKVFKLGTQAKPGKLQLRMWGRQSGEAKVATVCGTEYQRGES